MRAVLSPVLLALILGAATAASAQSHARLSVSVEGVRNDSGSVRCGLYASANGFREPGREMRGAVAPIKNGHATCVFTGVPAGTYAQAGAMIILALMGFSSLILLMNLASFCRIYNCK